MSALKQWFQRVKATTKEPGYSARSAMVRSPPAGRVTDKDDPHHEVWKPQFSSGDQTEKGRMPFFNTGFAVCPECCERNVWRFEEKAGVRCNGDTYGTEIFICQTKSCGWRTSFLYDDGRPKCIYYETKHWQHGVQCFPKAFMVMWADKHKLGATCKQQIFSKNITGNDLLAMAGGKQLEQELGLSRKEAERIRKALDQPGTALLTRQATK